MVDQVDAHDSPGFDEPPVRCQVVVAGSQVLGRMIVKQDARRRAATGCFPKHLSRMDQTHIEYPDREHGC